MRLFLFIFLCPLTLICQLKQGTWRGVLTLSEKRNELVLPFNFTVTRIKNKPIITIINANERIKVSGIQIKNDSIIFMMPVFDTGFRLQLKNDTLTGYWINYSKIDKNKILFSAFYNNKTRFETDKPSTVNFTGKYEVTFNSKKEDEYKAIGLFKQVGSKVTGTFLTETGDYRYLEGSVQNNNMALSCFDGAHAFLFFANSAVTKPQADSLSGKVFYGITGSEDWVAIRNDSFKLKDAENITYLKNKSEKIDFSFKNLNSQTVSINDERFKNKPIIIQIMGSWCPNCMDETAYLAKLYKHYNKKGLEIIALAYERTNDFEKAKSNVMRLKTKYNADYEFLITGLTGKQKATESLPFLNAISAFPTTIILNKAHKVTIIYTGFNGPATGKAYTIYCKKTEQLIEQLLLEK